MARTALERYSRLEAAGRYFDGESARPQAVMVSFGKRSLVIMGFDGVALAHWPLASLVAVGGEGDRAMQVAPDHASEERLVVDDSEMVEALRAVCPKLHHRPADRRGIRAALVWGALGIGSVLVMVFVIIPRLAEPLAEMIPPDKEAKLGDAVVEQIRVVLGGFNEENAPAFCAEPAGLAALETMTDRLRAVTDLPYPLRVSVMDHEMINAFAVPGGRVVLFKGLIREASSPEEVAGVLAHEIGHVIHRDPTVGVLRSAGRAGILGLLVGDVFGAAVVVGATEAVMNASYQREVEARADEEALAMLARARLPSAPFAQFFGRLAEEHGDMAGVLEYLSSHPALQGRADRAREGDTIGKAAFDPVLDDGAWVAFREVCSETSETLPD
ncbi:MAG: M48 family metallopeptidase [Pseudomonadota bacterium]